MTYTNDLTVWLINPPPPPKAFVHYQNPLIGLAYMAAVLEKKYNVAVIDCPALGITHEELRNEIMRAKPKIIGITSVTVTFSSAIRTAQVAKEVHPECLTILGGPHATVMDEQIIRDHQEVDIIVRGEGEQTLLELADLVFKQKLEKLHETAGITFRKGRKPLRTSDRPFIQNLDQLPYPAFKYFPLRKYHRFGKLILPVLSSRGCPFHCTFCLAPKMAGKRVRTRNPEKVVDELEYLKTFYSPDAFTFHDETFTYDQKRVLEICEGIKKRNINLPWDCSTRVDCVSKKLLDKMVDAGCELVSFGVESGSQKILNLMRKGTTVEQNEKAVKWAKESGLCVSISIIIGYPGETKETLKQTFDFIRRTEPDSVEMSLATPYPGIELYDLVKEMGLTTYDNWDRFDMQTPVFENPSFPINLNDIRKKFYDNFYTPSYILRHWFKGTFYSRLLARVGLNHNLSRVIMKLSRL